MQGQAPPHCRLERDAEVGLAGPLGRGCGQVIGEVGEVGADLGRVGGSLALVGLTDGEHSKLGGVADAGGDLLTFGVGDAERAGAGVGVEIRHAVIVRGGGLACVPLRTVLRQRPEQARERSGCVPRRSRGYSREPTSQAVRAARLTAVLAVSSGRSRIVAVALGIGAVSLVGTHFAALGQPGMRPLDALGITLLLIGPAALLARRRWPVAVLATVTAAALTYRGLGYPIGPVYLASVVALVSAIALGHRWASIAIAATGGVASVGWLALHNPGHQIPWGGVGAATAWLTAVIAAAELWRARTQRMAQDRATRAEIARRQGSDERLRIARELHDLLGHHVSLINIQAGVALHLMDGDPEQARTALTAIKQSSRDLLREMRTTLGVLRGVDEAPPHHPVAGLARLDELVTHTRTAGLPVEVTVRGCARELPTGVDLAAYRIVQEALTNARKHAGAARVMVHVGYHDESVSVRIDDDGVGPTGDLDGGGLAGMRERAAALGGTLHAGPRSGGGFSVSAFLPTNGANR